MRHVLLLLFFLVKRVLAKMNILVTMGPFGRASPTTDPLTPGTSA